MIYITVGGMIALLLTVLVLVCLFAFLMDHIFQKMDCKPKGRGTIKFFFDFLTNKTGGFQMETSVVAKKGAKIYGHIEPKDIEGQDVPIQDGSEIYSSSDENVLTVVANPKNPKYFIATLTGLVGVAKVQVKIDADPGAGETDLSDAATVTVTPDMATSVNIQFDETDDAPDTRQKTEIDLTATTGEAIVVDHVVGSNGSTTIPAVADTVTVNGAAPTGTGITTYTLTDGSSLGVAPDGTVASYTPAG